MYILYGKYTKSFAFEIKSVIMSVHYFFTSFFMTHTITLTDDDLGRIQNAFRKAGLLNDDGDIIATAPLTADTYKKIFGTK